MVKLSWIIQVRLKCNHKCPCKREAERDYTTSRRGEGNTKVEVEIGMMRLQAKECKQPKEAGRGKEHILP